MCQHGALFVHAQQLQVLLFSGSPLHPASTRNGWQQRRCYECLEGQVIHELEHAQDC